MSPACLDYIGVITTPYTNVDECPRQPKADAEPSVITLQEQYLPALKGIESTRYLQLVYWLDKADRSVLVKTPPQSYEEDEIGVFSLRAPTRPNPIALSVVELFEVKHNQLVVSPLDCVSGTPLLDIKSYVDQKPNKNFYSRGRCFFETS